MLKIYNTLTRKKEEFKPLHSPAVTMYSCGPTVYDYAHIGNLRAYVFNDLLVRTLRYFGYEVTQVTNITDVGHLTSDADTGLDKIEKGAARDKKSVWEIAEFYTDAFKEDLSELHITEPSIWAKATDHIGEMISLVSELEKRKYSYRIEGDGIYFDTSKLPDYGKLAQLDIEGLKKGARITFNPSKRNPTDFALWKFAASDEKRQMEWDSPWGSHSFPGWHIECSAMSMRYLGHAFDIDNNFYPENFETIDIHTGGVDHVAIHHTNEIAQTEAATGRQFVKYWMHNEFLLVGDSKMAKSDGNFYTLKTIKDKGFDPIAYRYFLLSAHYRTQLNFTWEALSGAAIAYNNLKKEVSLLRAESGEPADEFIQRFREYIGNDLAMPQALALLWEVVGSELPDSVKKATILEMDKILGLGLADVNPFSIPIDVQKLLDERITARNNKDYKKSDEIRDLLKVKGFEVEDTKDGVTVKPLS